MAKGFLISWISGSFACSHHQDALLSLLFFYTLLPLILYYRILFGFSKFADRLPYLPLGPLSSSQCFLFSFFSITRDLPFLPLCDSCRSCRHLPFWLILGYNSIGSLQFPLDSRIPGGLLTFAFFQPLSRLFRIFFSISIGFIKVVRGN
jgi:hypothetical protein